MGRLLVEKDGQRKLNEWQADRRGVRRHQKWTDTTGESMQLQVDKAEQAKLCKEAVKRTFAQESAGPAGSSAKCATTTLA